MFGGSLSSAPVRLCNGFTGWRRPEAVRSVRWFGWFSLGEVRQIFWVYTVITAKEIKEHPICFDMFWLLDTSSPVLWGSGRQTGGEPFAATWMRLCLTKMSDTRKILKNAAWSLAQRRTCDPSTRAFDAGLGLERENALEREPMDRMYKTADHCQKKSMSYQKSNHCWPFYRPGRPLHT